MALSFQINRSQCAMFCRVDLADKLTLAAALRNSNPKRFDGEPMLLPSLPDAPPEIPGIVLSAKDGSASLSVSSTRVDTTLNHPQGSLWDIRSLVDKESSFFQSLAETLSTADQVQTGISRVGVVLTLNAHVDSDELAQIRNRFLNSHFELGQNRVDLRFLDRQMWEEFQVNRWLRLGMMHEQDGTGSLEVILDYNTIPDEDYNLNGTRIGQFLEVLKSKAGEELEVFDG